jgi:hypothetical protein
MVFTVKSVREGLIELQSQSNGLRRSTFLSRYQAETLVRELNEALKGITNETDTRTRI